MVKQKKSIISDLKYDLNSIMDFFIQFKRAQGTAERTIEDYKKTFVDFNKVYVNNYNIDESIIKQTLLKYFSQKTGKSPATFNRPYSCLHAFFEWTVKEKYLVVNPIKETGLKKIKDEGQVRHIEEDVIKKLIENIDLSTYAGLRDYTIIILTLDSGIRPSEAFSLRIEDIDLKYNTLRIRREVAKTRTERILPLLPQTSEIIKRLLYVKPDDWENYIFMTTEGNRMNTNRWEKRLQEYSKKIGYKIRPYDLRHTFAIMFLKNGGNAFSLQFELGHTDLSMTKRYIKLSNDDIKEQHTNVSPINNFIKRTTRIQKLFKNH